MANQSAPQGFKPVNVEGGPYNGATVRVNIPATDTTTDVFIGDVVKAGGGASTRGYPTVTVVTATTDVPYGVITSFEANKSDLSVNYGKKGTARFGQCVLVDGVNFEIETNAVMDAGDVGMNVDYALTAGSTVTGYSKYAAIGGNVSTSAGDVLQVVSFVDREDNDLTLTNAKLIVRFNDDTFTAGRTGVT